MKRVLAACLCLAVLAGAPPAARAAQCPSLLRLVEMLPEGSIMAEVLIALGATDPPPTIDTLPAPGAGGGDAAGPVAVRRRLQQMCPTIFAPVCGENGQTYSNACFSYGAAIACQGECPCAELGSDGGVGGDDKAPVTGGITIGGGSGDMDQPICIDVYTPVCGTDGETYSNSCKALVAGVSVGCNGVCPCPDLISALQSGTGGLLLVPTDDSLLAALDSLNATDAEWLSDTALLQQLLARHVILTDSQMLIVGVPQPSLDGTQVVTEAGERLQLMAASKQRPTHLMLPAPLEQEIDVLQILRGCQLEVMQIVEPLQGPSPLV